MSDIFLNEFWPVYPRKVAKAKAKRMWDKQIKAGHKPETIIAGLQRLLPELKARRPEFQPHPASWLNDERWDDEPMIIPKTLSERMMEIELDLPNEPQRNVTSLVRDFEPVRRPKGQPSAIQMILAQRAKENN